MDSRFTHDSLPDSNRHMNFAISFDSSNARSTSYSTISVDDLDGELILPSGQDGGSFTPNISPSTASPSLSLSLGGEDSPNYSYDSNSSDPILKYIKQMLMEENVEEAWVFPGDFALQNTEKSFYDVLGEKPPESLNQPQESDVGPSCDLSRSSSDHGSAGTTISSSSSSSSFHSGEYNHYLPQGVNPLDEVLQSNFGSGGPQVYVDSISSSVSHGDGLMYSSVLVKNIFSNAESVQQFNKGWEEARKFLTVGNQWMISFQNNISSSEAKRSNLEMGVDNEKNEEEELLDAARKNHPRGEVYNDETRAKKQSASYVEETDLAELLDKVLLCDDYSPNHCQQTKTSVKLGSSADLHGPKGGKGRGRRRENKNSVDLRSLLVLCAQAVSNNDLRTATELLKQIRQNSSPDGDGSQRLAHYFANGLEARLAGTRSGTQNFYTSYFNKRVLVSAAEILKAYHMHLSTCPFTKFAIIYANHMISKLAEKAKVLHIIDFGISLGFQWPILIQKLEERSKQGQIPLKLRITAIDLPQAGFRPAEKVEESCRRLAWYCDRFHVPFEYNAIASRNWETIQIEDFRIKSNEMVAVNCLARFSQVSDETIEADTPRDAMLNLIRRIKPDVFVHAINSGAYNAPFFVTRFREALFHLSSVYDMLDATASGPNNRHERLILERDFYGREITNVVACEGPERVERPETFKQWQVRHLRAGFKQLPLDEEIIDKLQGTLKTWYHKDYMLDEDGKWMILGWKGRIMYATTCWVPL